MKAELNLNLLKDNFETGIFISISTCNQHLLSFCSHNIKIIWQSNCESPQENALQSCGSFPQSRW